MISLSERHGSIVFFVVILVSFLVLVTTVAPWLFNGAALVGSATSDVKAGAEAMVARSKTTGDPKETPSQITGCVQDPDGWSQARFNKIPGTIFVSIASYRDDECKDTVAHMFDQAKYPDNIYVGVCQQNKAGDEGDGEDCFDKCATCSARKDSGHIRVLNLDFSEARGPCFARYHASKLFRGEEFYLQIDSHTRFEPHWDETVLSQWRACENTKAVIGSYPPAEGQMELMRESDFGEMITMGPHYFDREGMPQIRAEVAPTLGRTKPIRVGFMPAGCVFFPGEALYDVPFDPYLSFLFFGEETLFSARLYTAGYDLYAPLKHFCTHHYGREEKPKYSIDHPEAKDCRVRALQRAKYLLGMTPAAAVHPDYLIDIDKYGMGKVRPLAAYERMAGINLKGKTYYPMLPKP